jgi:hypothetical protein
MKRMAFVAWVGLILAISCTTPAGSTRVADATAEAAESQDGSLICETQKRTGSHIPRRVCRTREQVEQERLQAEEMIRRAERTNEKISN